MFFHFPKIIFHSPYFLFSAGKQGFFRSMPRLSPLTAGSGFPMILPPQPCFVPNPADSLSLIFAVHGSDLCTFLALPPLFKILPDSSDSVRQTVSAQRLHCTVLLLLQCPASR